MKNEKYTMQKEATHFFILHFSFCIEKPNSSVTANSSLIDDHRRRGLGALCRARAVASNRRMLFQNTAVVRIPPRRKCKHEIHQTEAPLSGADPQVPAMFSPKCPSLQNAKLIGIEQIIEPKVEKEEKGQRENQTR
jgi:hypothetical protein